MASLQFQLIPRKYRENAFLSVWIHRRIISVKQSESWYNSQRIVVQHYPCTPLNIRYANIVLSTRECGTGRVQGKIKMRKCTHWTTVFNVIPMRKYAITVSKYLQGNAQHWWINVKKDENHFRCAFILRNDLHTRTQWHLLRTFTIERSDRLSDWNGRKIQQCWSAEAALYQTERDVWCNVNISFYQNTR